MTEGGVETTDARRRPHPITFDIEYPDRISRLSAFFRLILAIPQLVIVYLLFIPLSILTLLAWFGILFTGRYPRAFFDFNVGVLRWGANVIAYCALLRNEYPPFSWEPGEYSLTLDIPHAERQSRLRLFVRLFTIIPNQFVFGFVQLGWLFTTFMAWGVIMFTGKYPRGLHKFGAGVMRWYQRQAGYLYLLRDEYPPYSINAAARPGNEVVSGIIGFPFFALYVGLYAMQFQGIFSDADTARTSLAPGVIAREHPSAKASGLRLTLLDYDSSFSGVTVEVEAEKDGWLPTFFTPALFSLEPCYQSFDGASYSIDDWEGDSFDVYWARGSDRVTLHFDVVGSEPICALSYFTMSGPIRFEFD